MDEAAVKAHARATIGSSWVDFPWGKNGPPRETARTTTDGMIAALWRNTMSEHGPASGGSWRNPACTVTDGKVDHHEVYVDRIAIGNVVKRSPTQYDVYSRNNLCSLASIVTNATRHAWIRKKTLRTNANKNLNSDASHHEGVFNLRFECLDGGKWTCGLTRHKERLDKHGIQIVHLWISGSSNALPSSRQKVICLALNLLDFLCVFEGTGLMAYRAQPDVQLVAPRGHQLAQSSASQERAASETAPALPDRDSVPTLPVAARSCRADASIPDQRSYNSGAAALSGGGADESIPNRLPLSAASGAAALTCDELDEEPAYSYPCSASGALSASGHDSPADDAPCVSEGVASLLSPMDGIDKFFETIPTHANVDAANTEKARMLSDILSTSFAAEEDNKDLGSRATAFGATDDVAYGKTMEDYPPGDEQLEFALYCTYATEDAKAIVARQLVAPLGTSENAREETAARPDSDFMHNEIRDAIAPEATSSASDVPEEEQRSAQAHMEEAIPFPMILQHGADRSHSSFLGSTLSSGAPLRSTAWYLGIPRGPNKNPPDFKMGSNNWKRDAAFRAFIPDAAPAVRFALIAPALNTFAQRSAREATFPSAFKIHRPRGRWLREHEKDVQCVVTAKIRAREAKQGRARPEGQQGGVTQVSFRAKLARAKH